MMAAAFPGLSPDLRLFLSLCRLLINFLFLITYQGISHSILTIYPINSQARS